ncbi:MAG: nucleotide exchange factor GrpE, partial [Pseudomonadota bacterium]|nr:nucleotide exchange factor GrpE [Pseudomonadota bacterium]
NPEVPNNTVLQVVQAGFTIGDRVLRPAMVGVSKGGPKAEPSAAGTAGTENAQG